VPGDSGERTTFDVVLSTIFHFFQYECPICIILECSRTHFLTDIRFQLLVKMSINGWIMDIGLLEEYLNLYARALKINKTLS